MRRLLPALAGALGALVLWLAITVPLALRVLTIEPVTLADTAPPPLPPAFDPARPTAAILLSQAGTEITDFLAPYAILAESGAFNVVAVASTAGVAPTNGALGIVPQLTLAAFDAAHPEGPAVVIVPNLLDPDNAVVGDWLRARRERGAVLASICEGARVLAHNGFLDGHAATTHWAALASLRDSHPRVRWRDDRRVVDDGPVISSAGVTAGIDAALHVVERFAGATAARRSAEALALPPPGSAAAVAPRLTAGSVAAGVLNGAFAWPKTRVAVQLSDGIDELAVAAVLDAYPRSFAAVARSIAPGRVAVRSRHGLLLVPAGDSVGAGDDVVVLPDVANDRFFAYERVLTDLAQRYDGATAALVAAQLEYAWPLPAAPALRPAPLLGLAALLAVGALAGAAIAARRRSAA